MKRSLVSFSLTLLSLGLSILALPCLATGISKVEPIHGYATSNSSRGTIITLAGSSFTNVSSVKFNGLSVGQRVADITTVSSGYQVINDTQIKTIVPANAVSGKISITTPNGTFPSSAIFTVAPRLTTLWPSSGGIGSIITLYGYNMSAVTKVTFNGINAGDKVSDITLNNNGFQIVSVYQIKVRVPYDATTGKISIVNNFGDSASTATIFKVLPTIISVTPDSGYARSSGLPGTLVTLVGKGFTGVAAVRFNGVSVGSRVADISTASGGYQIVDDTQIKTLVPSNATTGKISISTPDGPVVSNDDFTVHPRPVEIEMPAMFGDNMVLQRNVAVPIWGKAAPGQTITVSFANQVKQTIVDNEGIWSVKLDPLSAMENGTLQVRANSTITFHNVAVGEVWLCAGQSNMSFPLAQADNAAEALTTASDKNLRLFTVTPTVSPQPKPDVEGAWFLADNYSTRSFSAVAYFFGRELRRKLNVPIGLIQSAYAATPAEAWTTEATLRSDPDLLPILQRWERILATNPALANSPLRPANVYNAMVKPLAPFAVRGVAWYQGEANVWRAYQYRKLLPAMMGDWHRAWGSTPQTLPFHIVQIPNLMARKSEPAESIWAELREAQALHTSPRTLSGNGLIVTIDLGDANDLHPKNKLDVGLRLALVALGKTYKHAVEYSGPCLDSMRIEGGRIRLIFTHTDGLSAASLKPNALAGFAIAGADGQWQWASATIHGNSVLVSNSAISKPVAVRYAWADNPFSTLYNSAGLPAAPFRTDDWPGLTINKK
jgi:sialate O-acetylesterase